MSCFGLNECFFLFQIERLLVLATTDSVVHMYIVQADVELS